ncbi:MAG: alpha/beta fold hydrolase [Saprospirales bacterium]|nr:alpha/beta fold hydrolase [Saprospirales bacterium]
MMHTPPPRSYPPVEGVEITHRFLDIGNCKIHVAEAGERTFIYVPRLASALVDVAQTDSLFAKHYRVIVPDIRGFGWSDATPGGYLKDELAEDFAKLVRALGYQEVRLLSHDWGGWIGYIASAKYPGLIRQHFATNIPPIWPKVSFQMIPATLRFGYMFQISMPFFGPRMLQRSGRFVHHLFTRGNTHPIGWTDLKRTDSASSLKTSH